MIPQLVKNTLIIALSFFFTLTLTNSLAQKESKRQKKASLVQLNDSVQVYSQSDIFRFPNVNVVAEYYDAAKVKKMRQLSDSHQDQELYKVLREYVSHFGISNFTRNSPMLWTLAKLSKQYGQPGEAILLYKLAIKHYQEGINVDDIYAQYDSIEPDKKRYFVPLSYYYELVDYRKEIDTLKPPHAVLENMGESINSLKPDYGPAVGNVDYVLLFTSKRNEHNAKEYNEDLFYSVKVDGGWAPAEPFQTINTRYNEGSACLSADGSMLIFSRCDAPGSIGHCDLYSSSLQADSTWGKIVNLGPSVNSTSWDSQPTLTHSGDTLFFASDRLGGFGLSDIYYSIRDKSGHWGKALNAGPIVNTRGNDVSPFFHHRFNVLYFSSTGHPLNFGNFDIYKSYRTRNSWTEPQNVGPLVNGTGDEYYFSIDSRSHDLYYARSEESDPKNLDLFSFPVPMEAQPEAVVLLKGTLKDRQGKPMAGVVSIIDLDHGVEVAPKFLREDGSFDFSLINKRNYLLIIQGDEFFRVEEAFFLDGEKELNKVAEPIDSKIAFQSLEFENGKAEILPDMHADLNKVANFLVDHPQLKLRISGHTDSSGNEASNLKLSQERADAIRNYLVDTFSIDSGRITAIGFGSAKPLVVEQTDEHKQLNRRVEFEIFRE